jgi:hypothetical protein
MSLSSSQSERIAPAQGGAPAALVAATNAVASTAIEAAARAM